MNLLNSASPLPFPPAATLAPVARHFTLPFHETATIDLRDGETLDALVRRSGWATRVERKWSFRLPTICVVNGRPVLQKEWRRLHLRTTDDVMFWSKPLGGSGGGGKQILGLLAVIALGAFAPWAAGAMGFAAGTLGAHIVTAAITIGGGLLISALTAPKPAGQGDKIEQVYSVSASGNRARLLEPITVQYGRVKSFPDYATTPWSEFEGNDQYLNVLLSIGLGAYEYETLFIDDTILWDSVNGTSATFDNVDIAFYAAGEEVTLFPTNVVQADEVNGQEVPDDGTFLGPFVANAAGTNADELACDFVFPAGCYGTDSDGDTTRDNAFIRIEARKVNDAGEPLGDGSWTLLHNLDHQYKNKSPVRLTVKMDVDSGRYEVRVRRTDSINSQRTNVLVWAGLRAFLHDSPDTFPVATVAIRIKANNQISNAKKFGVLCTRVLPVWDAEDGVWVDTATRSPLWAFYDAATNSVYGAARAASKVDFQSVYDMAAAAEARGDKFDYRFESTVPAPEAFDTILRVTRARHRWSGDVLTVVRDEWSDTPRMLLTDREIVRGSLNIDYALNTDDSADAVILEYLDQATWRPAEIQYPPNTDTFTAVAPTRVRIEGIVARTHAYREAAFYYLQSQMRRVFPALDTEHDGRMLGFGSRVRIQSELPQTWGATGVVVSNDEGTLTLDPAPAWASSGNHYIAIRTKTGKQFGPVLCTKGNSDAEAVLDGTDLTSVETAQGMTLADALARRDGADDPSFDFGVGTSRARNCIVLSGRPSGDHVSLKFVVDNEAVHETDLGEVPVAPSLPALRDPIAPVISSMYANFRQGMLEPVLEASWSPAAGAQYYVAQVSYDEGDSWTPVYEGQMAKFSAVVDRAALRLRVQGVGERVGAWSQIDVAAPTIALAPGTVDFSSLTELLEARLEQLNPDSQAALVNTLDEFRTQIEALAAQQGGAYALLEAAQNSIISVVGQKVAGNEASVTTLQTATANDREAIATALQALISSAGDSLAEGMVRFITAATATDAVASFAIEVRASTSGTWAAAGIYIDVGAFENGAVSRIRLVADQISLEVAGTVLDAALFTLGGEPVNVPIDLDGEVRPNFTTRRTQFETELDDDAVYRIPNGATPGYRWEHIIRQDTVGGHTLSFNANELFGDPPSIGVIGSETTVLAGRIMRGDPLRMLVTAEATTFEGGTPDFAFVDDIVLANTVSLSPVNDAGGQAGELMFVTIMMKGGSSEWPTPLSPEGWTEVAIVTTDDASNDSHRVLMRRLNGSETGTVTFYDGFSGDRGGMYVARFSGGGHLSFGLVNVEGTNSNPSPQSIPVGTNGITGPLIVFAVGQSNGTVSPLNMTPTADIDSGSFALRSTPNANARVKFKIFDNDANPPADVTVDMDDEGQNNALLSGYIKG